MKLYNGLSPNGARLDIFLVEKGIEIPTVSLEVIAGEAQKPDFLKVNGLGQVPVLELDSGEYLSESIAICRYLESLYPEPNLFGENAVEQAFIEMWARRMELWLFWVAGDIGLHTIDYFKYRVEQNADYAAYCRRTLVERFAWLDKELSDGRAFVAGDKFSIADVIGMSLLFIMGFMQIEIPEQHVHARRWQQAMLSRPSFPKMPSEAAAE